MKHFNLHITLKHLLIRNEKMIGIQFQTSKLIQNLIKTLPNPRWSEEHNAVYIKNNSTNLTLLFDTFRGVAWIDTRLFISDKPIKDNPILNIDSFRNRKKINGYKYCPESYLTKLELRRYAFNTAKTYISLFEKFINRFYDIPINHLTEIEIRQYLKELHDLELSNSYLHQMVNSIKFYFEVVMNMPNRMYTIERPRKESKLPKVLSVEEVKLLIENTNNIKHRCVISLLYSAGLRRSELLNLKVNDIDSKRMLIFIGSAKGNKDRYTLLSKATLTDLRIYFKQWQPKVFLFEGIKGNKYSPTSVANVVNKAAFKAKIRKKVTPHMLRHSFATQQINIQQQKVLYLQLLVLIGLFLTTRLL